MSSTNELDALHQIILDAMKQRTEEIVSEEAVEAGKRVEKRVREASGQIATSVLSFVDMQRMSDRLIITVKLPQAKE